MVQLFSPFGPVLQAVVIFNARGSKGFGFVTMAREEDAQKAMARLNHSMIDGRSISINLANPKKSSMDRELSQAQVRLEQAELEVQRLREELCSELGFRKVQ